MPSKDVTFAGLVFRSKAAKALATTPSKDVTFAGLVFRSKAAKALATSAVKRRDFCRAGFPVASGEGPCDERRQKT
jgi:hypothetical protein